MTETLPKFITPDNWTDPDPRSLKELADLFASPEDMLKAILEPVLIDEVPVEVLTLFKSAQGALIYGYFYYLLYALGVGHLCRTAEAAITYKYESVNGPQKNQTFKSRIDWLANKTIIPRSKFKSWHYIREIRNYLSHPEFEIPFPADMAIQFLGDIAQIVNTLFEEK